MREYKNTIKKLAVQDGNQRASGTITIDQTTEDISLDNKQHPKNEKTYDNYLKEVNQCHYQI